MQNNKWWPPYIVRADSDIDSNIKHFQSIEHIKNLLQVQNNSIEFNWILFIWRCSMLCVVTRDLCSPASCACSPAPRPPDWATRPRWGRGWPRCCPAQSPGSLRRPCSLRPCSRRPLGPRHARPYRAAVAREDNTLYSRDLWEFLWRRIERVLNRFEIC